MLWYNILDWFSDRSERQRLIRNFNNAARDSFIRGVVPTMLEASISTGDSAYKHSFSKFLYSGFRIKVLADKPLTKNELQEIANVVLSNQELTRKLVALGWDTLEIHGDGANYGIKCALKEFAFGLLN